MLVRHKRIGLAMPPVSVAPVDGMIASFGQDWRRGVLGCAVPEPWLHGRLKILWAGVPLFNPWEDKAPR